MYVSQNQSMLLTESYANVSQIESGDFVEGNLNPVPAGTLVALVLEEQALAQILGVAELLDTYYFRLVFSDDGGLTSTSNIVSAVYSSPVLPGPGGEVTTQAPKSSLSGGEIAGIVIGTLAGVAIILGLLWYFFVKRKQ